MAEIAGLVLGAFPLTIKALDVYVKAMQSVKKWFEYRQRMQRVIQTLVLEEMKFENTCLRLLQDSVSQPEVEHLLAWAKNRAKTETDPWRKEALRVSLQALLGTSFDIFLVAASQMKDIFDELKEKLGLDAEYLVSWCHTWNPDRPNCSDDRLQPEWVNFKAHKRQWKKLQLSLLDGTIKELLEHLDKGNKDIADLVGHSQHMNTVRPSKATTRARRYDDIRKHARDLYGALRHAFARPCGCTLPHNASLCLEHRDPVRAVGYDQKSALQFRVLFSFEGGQTASSVQPPWDWRETSIEPIQPSPQQSQTACRDSPQLETVRSLTDATIAGTNVSAAFATTAPSLTAVGGRGGLKTFHGHSTAPTSDMGHSRSSRVSVRSKSVSFALENPNPQHSAPDSLPESSKIEDLCSAILNVTEVSSLGVLADENEHRHRVSITSVCSEGDPLQTVSLQDLLTQAPPGRKERLILGLKLASTLLQLHNTPWLAEVWGKVDIRFRKRGDEPRLALLSQPLLSKSFVKPDCQNAPPEPLRTAPSHGVRNQSIFALAIILTELWFGKPIDHLRATKDPDPQIEDRDVTDFATIKGLLELIYEEAGDWYGDAVRRCLHCEFDQRYESLDKEALKEAVHDRVVGPLEQHLHYFCGGTLEGVLV